MGIFKKRNLYSIKQENLKELDGFQDRAKPPKLDQEDTNNINKLITNKENGTVIKIFQIKKSQI